MTSITIVKVGGSLYDIPDLGPRLDRWLLEQAGERIILIPGGGYTADVVRGFHRTHGVGEERCHWLALRALSLNAHFLEGLLAQASGGRQAAEVVEDPGECPAAWQVGRTPVLDLFTFALADEVRPGCLPHSWTVTSDALAARAAAVAGAGRLVLLKSVTIPADMGWAEAARLGYVDEAFPGVVQGAAALEVRAVNFRYGTE
jgi:5-(aminomethyl)-3-furanmethanol phosphate kinase